MSTPLVVPGLPVIPIDHRQGEESFLFPGRTLLRGDGFYRKGGETLLVQEKSTRTIQRQCPTHDQSYRDLYRTI